MKVRSYIIPVSFWFTLGKFYSFSVGSKEMSLIHQRFLALLYKQIANKSCFIVYTFDSFVSSSHTGR